MNMNNTYTVYDNCTRNSGDSHVPWVCSGYTYLGILLTVIPCVIIMFSIVFGNTLVVLAVFRDRKMLKQLNNWYIVSLALADFFVGAFIMPFTLAQEVMGFWYFGTIVCEVWLALDVLFVTASILNMCVISIDRFWAVTHPTTYRQKRTGCCVRLLIAGAWIISLIICFPPAVGWRPERRLGECDVSTKLGYVIYSACGSFYIPVMIILMVYTRIHFITQKMSKKKLSQAANAERTLAISSQKPRKSFRDVISRRATFARNGSSAVQMNEKPEMVLVAKSVIPRSKSEIPMRLSTHTSPDKFRTLSLLEPGTPGVSSTAITETIEEPPVPTVQQDSIRLIAVSFLRKVSFEVDDLSGLTSSRKSSPPQATRSAETIHNSSGLTTVLSPEMAALTMKRKMLKRKERKATLLLGLILGGFIFCWLPFFVIYIIGAIFTQYSIGDVPPLLFKIFFWLGYCNSALNPLIYTVFNNEFKRAFKKILSIRH